MKIKHIAAIALTIVFIAGWPLGAFASDKGIKQGLKGSEVSCTVQEIYDFSAPDDAQITYPKTSVFLGDFKVGNILLKSNETLRLNLNVGMMSKTDDQDAVLTYDVIFNAPGEIDRTKAGFAYGIAVSLDSDEFRSADPGNYRAPLKFQVISNNSGEIVWEQTVNISVIKLSEQEGQQQNGSNKNERNIDVSNRNVTAASVQQTQPQLDKADTVASDMDSGESDQQQNDLFFIPDNEVPTGQSISDASLKWLAIFSGAVVLIILLYFLMRRRIKDKT